MRGKKIAGALMLLPLCLLCSCSTGIVGRDDTTALLDKYGEKFERAVEIVDEVAGTFAGKYVSFYIDMSETGPEVRVVNVPAATRVVSEDDGTIAWLFREGLITGIDAAVDPGNAKSPVVTFETGSFGISVHGGYNGFYYSPNNKPKNGSFEGASGREIDWVLANLNEDDTLVVRADGSGFRWTQDSDRYSYDTVRLSENWFYYSFTH